MKGLVRGLFRAMGYRITRDRPANRFEAADDALGLMRRQGYDPRVVIDGGANRGQFHRLARAIFPEAEFHLIEPQPACREALERLVRDHPGLAHYHPVALTEPGVSSVRMVGGGESGGGTGCFVAKATDHRPDELSVEAATLDELLSERVQVEHRALLKLDLESHEIPALKGATTLLERVEVVVTEVSFYDVESWGHLLFADTLVFLRERGFELYDVANLSHRPRDYRLRSGDVVFVRTGAPLLEDVGWE